MRVKGFEIWRAGLPAWFGAELRYAERGGLGMSVFVI